MKKKLWFIIQIVIIFLICTFFLGLNFVSNAASVSVSGGTVNEGENITVNFSVSDNNGGFSGNVSYDSSKLEYVSSSVNGTGSYNNGSVAIVGGNSFSVVFKAKSSGSANVSLENIMLGDGSSASGSFATITINSNTPAPASDPTPTTNNDSSSTPSAPTVSNNASNSTPEPEPTFKSVNDKVYATKSINVRSSWSTSSSKIGGLSKNQEVTRTGIGDNGWSRISYNGKTAYVSTSLITTTKPEEEVTPEEDKPEEVVNPEEQQNPEIVIEENGEGVIPENKELTEEEIYQNLVNNIGTIPEVGKNYNIYLYISVCFVSVLGIIFIFKKI